jgi:23S rRNA (pseudouridine1915-N3)-methyltransferase
VGRSGESSGGSLRLEVIAIGTRAPAWVVDGVHEFRKRMPRELAWDLREIAAARRGKNVDTPRIRADEADRLRRAIPTSAYTVALDVRGDGMSTPQLAAEVARWQREESAVAILIGGADGMTDDLISQADRRWSLSALTFPHFLVRVLIAEQLYRAHSLNVGHPYHRE